MNAGEPYVSLFVRAADKMCGGSEHIHCMMNVFVVAPFCVAFVLMVPFVFDWFGGRTLNYVEVARFPQSSCVMGLRIACAVLLAVWPIAVLVLEVEGIWFNEPAYTGTYVWAILSGSVWLLNALALARRHRQRLAEPKFHDAWYIAIFLAEAARSFVALGRYIDGKGHLPLDASCWIHNVLLMTFFLPAAVELWGSRCCERGSGTQKSDMYRPLLEADTEPQLANAVKSYAGKDNPYERAGLTSRVVFWWMNALMKYGYHTHLEDQDIPPLPVEDQASEAAKSFHMKWYSKLRQKVLKRKKPIATGQTKMQANQFPKVDESFDYNNAPYIKDLPGLTQDVSVLGTLARAFGATFYAGALFKTIYDLLQFVGPVLLHEIIDYLTAAGEDRASKGTGFGYVGLLFASNFLGTLVLHQYFFRVQRVGLRLKSAIISAVYRKALKLSIGARQSKPVGEIVNIMSTDAQRMQDLTTYVQMIWSGPLQIVLAIILLYREIGPAVFAGVGVMVFFVLFNVFLGRILKKIQVTLMSIKDKRVDLTNEVLGGMKLIKLSGWEDDFLHRVNDMRNRELRQLKKYLLLNQAFSVLWIGLPVLVSLISFATFTWLGNDLTPARAFTSLSLFNILRFPMAMLPMLINSLVEASVSLRRIRSFLMAPEVDTTAVLHDETLPGAGGSINRPRPEFKEGDGVPISTELKSAHAIFVKDAEFVWDQPKWSLPTDKKKKGKDSDSKEEQAQEEEKTEEQKTKEEGSTFVLTVPHLVVPWGSRTVVVGAVGSGKTALIHAILGEMLKVRGEVFAPKSISYVSQTAFIMNATLKANILFGAPYDEARYNAVVKACALTADLEILPAGDQTEIGEKGINLSGGQKQRVSLARAAYANADVYLFDDPLSALDAHVGAQVFDELMNGLLKSKTQVLVTHGLQYVPRSDEVIVVDNGSIPEFGTYEELMARPGSALARVMAIYEKEAEDALNEAKEAALKAQQDEEARVKASLDRAGLGEDAASLLYSSNRSSISDGHREPRDKSSSFLELKDEPHPTQAVLSRAKSDQHPRRRHRQSSASEQDDSEGKQGDEREDDEKLTDKGRLVEEEERSRGKVSWKVYGQYFQALGGYAAVTGLLLLYTGAQAVLIVSNWYLSSWSSDVQHGDTAHSPGGYLSRYAILCFSALAAIVVVRIFLAIASTRAARVLHEGILSTVIYAFQSFFDTTPIGRILNRFSQDQYTIDERLLWSFTSLLNTAFSVLGTVAVIASVTPWFLAGITPFVIVYYFFQRYYVRTSRELQRLISVSSSPIYAFFSETLTGAVTIRAFRDQKRFIDLSDEKVDRSLAAYFVFTSSNRWLAVRLEFMGTMIVTMSALFAVISTVTGSTAVTPSLAGLSISYALSITQSLNWVVRMMGQIENQIVAVERNKQYTTPLLETEPGTGDKAPKVWPTQGAIDIRNLSLRYRKGLPKVLDNLSLSIKAGEKIGICGRTGAGKSSFISALFRLADVQEGTITIDGGDINQLHLRELRSRLAIIPQEPTLFSGTLRQNLDPFNQYSDQEIMNILDHVALGEAVRKAEGGLETHVSEGGENWSTGQRQLICMARALLRRCKIVVLDEATAGCDVETDAILQTAIRKEFKDCTVLTIAHRLHTIIDSDRILVLERGRVAEFDSPSNLLNTPDSLFKRLLHESATARGGDDNTATHESVEAKP